MTINFIILIFIIVIVFFLRRKHEFFVSGPHKNSLIKAIFKNKSEEKRGISIDKMKKRLNDFLEEKFNVLAIFKDKITKKELESIF